MVDLAIYNLGTQSTCSSVNKNISKHLFGAQIGSVEKGSQKSLQNPNKEYIEGEENVKDYDESETNTSKINEKLHTGMIRTFDKRPSKGNLGHRDIEELGLSDGASPMRLVNIIR